MNPDRRFDWYELVLLAVVVLCLALALLELLGSVRDPRFTETGPDEPAMQVDSVWTPPAPVARACMAFDFENFDCTETR